MEKLSNINDIHLKDSNVSAISIFKEESTNVTSIALKKDNILKEHITKIPALLLCFIGKVVYSDESGQTIELTPGDYITIEPNVKHKLDALENSQLVLIK